MSCLAQGGDKEPGRDTFVHRHKRCTRPYTRNVRYLGCLYVRYALCMFVMEQSCCFSPKCSSCVPPPRSQKLIGTYDV